jgi:hypothetical protein
MDKTYIPVCCGLILLLTGLNTQATQIISPAATQSFVAAGDTVTLALRYQVSAPETATETGLGLRVHYDSSLLDAVSTSLFTSAQQPVGNPAADTGDFDNNPQTDRYFIVSWLDFAAQWPGNISLPLTIAEIDFTVQNTLSTISRIGFSATATAKNTGLQTMPLTLCPKPAITISTMDNSVTEGQTGGTTGFVFQSNRSISADCGDLTLNYILSGNAVSGEDYTPLPAAVTIPAGASSAELNVAIIDDDRVEDDETLIVTLQNSPDYQLNNTSATLTIHSEDQPSTLPEVNLSAGKLTVTEGQGGSLLVFAERSATNLSQPLEVMLELGGTATVGSDFHTFTGMITIPAGSTKAFVVLLLKDDGTQEDDETLNISIVPSATYQRGEDSFLQLIIQDDELNQHTSLPVSAQNDAATTAGQPQIRQVPGSSQWMLMMMSVLLSGVAAWRLRAKKQGEAA